MSRKKHFAVLDCASSLRAVLLATLLYAGPASGGENAAPEPNMKIAAQWWPEIENVWTPIGWKDHPLRFNVLYNGILVGEPVRQRSWGQGIQLTFIPSASGVLPPVRTNAAPYALAAEDGGVGEQGWTDGATPVLWTEWRTNGLRLRTEVFSHMAGGGPVSTGREPLFAWVRLRIQESKPARRDDRYGWLIQINHPHLDTKMERDLNLVARPAKAKYPSELKLETSGRGGFLLEPDGRVRLGIAPTAKSALKFLTRAEDGGKFLRIELPRSKGARTDLLVPLLPVEQPAFERELALGLDGALAESERFWGLGLQSKARVETPEPLVNQAFRVSPKFAEVVAERDPGTGLYSQLSGSWHYEKLWATPTSMNLTMILDALGYHDEVEKYLEIFKANQGTVRPPGGHYQLHHGYFSTPKTLTSIDWLTDHGAILHAVCHHGLVTGDQRFIEEWTPAILKACEFIRDSRAMTNHGGVENILPSAVPTDERVSLQAVWNDGWNYKGLVSAVRLLERMGHPRAAEFARVARDYKASFVGAFRTAAEHTPEWTDAQGRKHHLVPTALPGGGDLKHPFYLDTGPLFLVYAGLMDADDELMRSALRYFREGPNTRIYDLKGCWYQPVSLRHEISSCEPCYSWNVFHSHQTGDRSRYLEGMYSLFAGAISRHTSIGCEHRGGIGGTLFSSCLPLELARLAVIDDELNPEELHLLRLAPRAWLETDFQTKFENLSTEFGPVSLRFQVRKSGRQLAVSFHPKFRASPKKILLHVPPLESIRQVVVNGQSFRARTGELIDLRKE